MKKNIERAYAYLLKNSKVFKNASMDRQGELTIALATKLTEQEK